jgi:transcriptional regulator with GAF, ATPase, and Fis domain
LKKAKKGKLKLLKKIKEFFINQMSQELSIFSSSRNILYLNQLEAIKSLTQLLTREISSIETTPELVSEQIVNGQKICLNEEIQKFETALIRCALICTMGRQNAAAGLLGLKNSTLNEKIKRLKINIVESI